MSVYAFDKEREQTLRDRIAQLDDSTELTHRQITAAIQARDAYQAEIDALFRLNLKHGQDKLAAQNELLALVQAGRGQQETR